VIYIFFLVDSSAILSCFIVLLDRSKEKNAASKFMIRLIYKPCGSIYFGKVKDHSEVSSSGHCVMFWDSSSSSKYGGS